MTLAILGEQRTLVKRASIEWREADEHALQVGDVGGRLIPTTRLELGFFAGTWFADGDDDTTGHALLLEEFLHGGFDQHVDEDGSVDRVRFGEDATQIIRILDAHAGHAVAVRERDEIGVTDIEAR